MSCSPGHARFRSVRVTAAGLICRPLSAVCQSWPMCPPCCSGPRKTTSSRSPMPNVSKPYYHLLWEQELDVRPDVAQAIERATGTRAGRVYWRSAHDHLYALELADLGRGYPAMASIYGYWDRYE